MFLWFCPIVSVPFGKVFSLTEQGKRKLSKFWLAICLTQSLIFSSRESCSHFAPNLTRVAQHQKLVMALVFQHHHIYILIYHYFSKLFHYYYLLLHIYNMIRVPNQKSTPSGIKNGQQNLCRSQKKSPNREYIVMSFSLPTLRNGMNAGFYGERCFPLAESSGFFNFSLHVHTTCL